MPSFHSNPIKPMIALSEFVLRTVKNEEHSYSMFINALESNWVSEKDIWK